MSGHHSPQKRPRLSLQIRALSTGPSVRTSRTIAALVNPQSPTSFNTLHNVYNSAISKSTPTQQEPVTAINTSAGQQPTFRPQMDDASKPRQYLTPYTATLPDTPLSAHPMSPPTALEIQFPSTMTATPPLSAGPMEATAPKPFSFSDMDLTSARSPRTYSPRDAPRRRTTLPVDTANRPLPYTRQRQLHSILRNSPLPPPSTVSPISPRRQSVRLQEKAARRVGYNSPLEQTITTNKYTKSHIDLLCEEASPYSPANPQEDPEVVLDLAMAYSGDETLDGGQTPGPFEEMRRRMAGLVTSTPISATSGVRKRKRKDKKRSWVWTIGTEDDEEHMSGAVAAVKAAAKAPEPLQRPPRLSVPIIAAPQPPARLSALSIDIRAATVDRSNMDADLPTPSIESSDFSQDSIMDSTGDLDMSDTCSIMSDATTVARGLTPADMDMDLVTPRVARKETPSKRRRLGSSRLASEDLINPETGMRRDTPIPSDLIT